MRGSLQTMRVELLYLVKLEQIYTCKRIFKGKICGRFDFRGAQFCFFLRLKTGDIRPRDAR